jgi:hypothetical protein
MLVALLARATPCAAQIYKWTDASGTIHFSDNPPPRKPGASAVEVLPETQHRPAVVNRPVPDDEPESPEPAVAPRDQGRSDDTDGDYGAEPEDEPVDSGAIIVDDAARDPEVWLRANSPRNRPGQPIRQPIRPARRGR